MRLDNGIATVYRGENTGEPGGKPVITYRRKVCASYYAEKTVGVQRFWTAKAHDGQANLLVEIQRNAGIRTSDRCTLAPYSDPDTAGAYKIIQVQHLIDDDGLPVTDLTLERIGGIDEP